MMDEEAFSMYLAGLNPHLREQVGAHARENLEEAIAMAQRIEIYRGSDSKPKGVENFQKKKKGSVNQVQGKSFGGTSQVNMVQPQQKRKQRQKEKGKS